ncbi:Uma2 family endonuclease [Gloeobacter morelensis]|uniref:Uma2 family endonuclease n=1 Tax=Gloeobacter morelensis TaxID=2907343 RepID=UPI001E4B91DD|nr:Uma2 family endonuclease [Gloeobacter morelensis]
MPDDYTGGASGPLPAPLRERLMTTPAPPPVEGSSTLYGVDWEQFKTTEATLAPLGKGVKLSHFNGVLEIMSPIGPRHEDVKSTLGLLLEAYIREKGIRFYVCGGFTLASPKTASGTPDASYAIGTRKKIPDIVIEVIITSGRLDKTETYRPQQVPEVWFWKKGQITLFHSEEQGYIQREHSVFFPALELSVLQRYLDFADSVRRCGRVCRGHPPGRPVGWSWQYRRSACPECALVPKSKYAIPCTVAVGVGFVALRVARFPGCISCRSDVYFCTCAPGQCLHSRYRVAFCR